MSGHSQRIARCEREAHLLNRDPRRPLRRMLGLLLAVGWALFAVPGGANIPTNPRDPNTAEAPSIAPTPLESTESSSNDRIGIGHDVVAVFGDTRVTGPVGGDVLSILGSSTVDNRVQGNVVAVFGSIRLGPHADIGGQVVAVGGVVQRDPMAIVHGRTQQSARSRFGPGLPGGRGPWFRHGLRDLRPLTPTIGWIWAAALVSLLLCLCIALIFRNAVQHCVQTLERHPGHSLLTALLTALLVPPLLLLLVVSLIGIPAIPLVVLALLCGWMFGKVTMLVWVGQRCLRGAQRAESSAGVAQAVLVGGLIMLVLYLIPLMGLLVYQTLGLIGLGAVVYTLIRRSQDARPEGTPGPVEPTGPGPPATSTGAAPVDGAFVPPAGFWIRMLALLLDGLLVGVIVHLLPHTWRLELPALALYGAVMWRLRGSTLGGMVFNLRVVRLDGRPLDWGTAIVRALGCFLSLMVAGLGFLWIAFDAHKQAWHDKFAGTVVVRVARAPSLV